MELRGCEMTGCAATAYTDVDLGVASALRLAPNCERRGPYSGAERSRSRVGDLSGGERVEEAETNVSSEEAVVPEKVRTCEPVCWFAPVGSWLSAITRGLRGNKVGQPSVAESLSGLLTGDIFELRIGLEITLEGRGE